MKIEKIKVEKLEFFQPKKLKTLTPAKREAMTASIDAHGEVLPIFVFKKGAKTLVIDGHHRVEIERDRGTKELDCCVLDLKSEKEARQAWGIINSHYAKINPIELKSFFKGFKLPDLARELSLFNLSGNLLAYAEAADKHADGSLIQDYDWPPFSVIDTRNGQWQQAAKPLKALFQSEEGRADNLLEMSATVLQGSTHNGTSVFDPQLAKVMYRWFADGKSTILDPFAGGVVRGAMAALAKKTYTGYEVRAEQIADNKAKLAKLKIKGVEYIHKSCETIAATEAFDMLLTCPPYYWLEKYSDHADDISNRDEAGFDKFMADVMKKCFRALKKDSFAVWVVGTVRRKNGSIINLPGKIVQWGEAAGFEFYNDIVYITPSGTAALRARKIFDGGAKVVRVHQNIIVLKK